MKHNKMKEYLPFYLGSQVETPGGVGKMISIATYGFCTVTLDGDKYFKYEEVRPLLRPLSSMTEEEAVEFIHLKNKSILCNIDRTEITKVSFGSTKNIINFTYFKQRGAGAEGGGKTYYVNASDPDQFAYLLSRGFDLFGLIKAGLAIDKTTINQPKT